ncbi:MAG: ATP-binding protein [Patescibacteria group bacterium]
MDTLFINRTHETKWLEEAYKKAHKEGQLLIIYGKRRVGKTELVTHFINQGQKPAIYYLANETTREEQLQSATSVFARGFNDTFLSKSSFSTWREFFDYLIMKIEERSKTKLPMIFVFDEFPFIAKSDSGISSFFQYGWEMGFKNQRVMIIIMGSSISMIYKHTLSKKSALYGRRTGQWRVEPFGYAETKEFYKDKPFTNTFPLYAISGGIPAYARVFDGGKTIKQNIIEKILPQGEFLNIEPELLLAEEFDDPRTYLNILQAIGLGRTKFSQILQNSHLQATSLPIYLQNLTQLRLIKKEVPVTESVPEKSKKGNYSLSDAFLRFYFSFIFPNKSSIRNGSYEEFYSTHEQIITKIIAKTYEDTSYEFIQMAIQNGKLPQFEKLDRWWNQDTEIDLVGINSHDNTILFVETKWNTKPIGTEILNELRKKARDLKWGKPKRKEYYALIAKGGFTDQLKEQAKKENVVLIKEDHLLE